VRVLTGSRKEIRVTEEEVSGKDMFSVVSYNILADCHMEPQWYPYTPPDCRTAKARHPRLTAELECLAGDILCLQEVGSNYHSLLQETLQSQGYCGEYLRKELDTEEGLATYWREETFSHIQSNRYSFNTMLESALIRVGKDPGLATDCSRDHVLLVITLQHRHTGHILTVANIHTVWDDFTQLDVSTLHVAMALRELAGIKGALVFAGDFNSVPDMEPYIMVTQGGLGDEQINGLERKGSVKLGEEGSLVTCLREEYRGVGESEKLASSYLKIQGEEPRLTNYDNYDGEHPADWCLDYIWYSPSSLQPMAVLQTVGIPQGWLPDKTLPSDHLSLRTTFIFTPC